MPPFLELTQNPVTLHFALEQFEGFFEIAAVYRYLQRFCSFLPLKEPLSPPLPPRSV